MSWYLKVLKKYAVFEGRAERSEYWYFTLFNMFIGVVLSFVLGFIQMSSMMSSMTFHGPPNSMLFLPMLGLLYSLAVLLPSLGVFVRRLHDTGRSGAWFLIGLIPLVGAIVLLVFLAQDSAPGGNQYGSNPKSAEETA